MKLKFFELCKQLTFKSNHNQHKMSCVITKKNKVINVGWNENRTHPAAKTRHNMMHAELSAIIGLSYKELKGCDAYIYRETKLNELGMARPCTACYSMLKLAGIKRIFYSSPSGYMEEDL